MGDAIAQVLASVWHKHKMPQGVDSKQLDLLICPLCLFNVGVREMDVGHKSPMSPRADKPAYISRKENEQSRSLVRHVVGKK